MYPLSADKNPAGAAMKTAIFTHKAHEGRVERCETCHHTGDPVACATCHSVEGKAEGKFVTLERAMHATRVKPVQGKNTPTSCVSCHVSVYKERTECAGCHAIVKAKQDERWCATCHNLEVSPAQMEKGVAGMLDLTARGEIAAKALKQRKAPEPLINPNSAPRLSEIGDLSEKFMPNKFTHRRHIASLMRKIKSDELARAFHNSPAILCSTCHHNSPMTANPPRCASCHDTRGNAASERPSLKAAYHLQCMGCHDGAKVNRPKKTSCTTCHKVKAAAN